MKTSVVLLIFNRPDTTVKVFETIRQAKPSKLLVVADGPRKDKQSDVEKCTAARAIIDRVDWECEVLKDYADTNLGCERRVSSGLNWVFNQVEEAIILEDDCLPNATFFQFCEDLLQHYRHDNRIAVISGQNVQLGRKRTDSSYYFSRYPHCWGWASWRRAWQSFDFEMKLWSVVKEGNWLQDILGDKRAVRYWERVFQAAHQGNLNSWATRWTFSCWTQSYLSILANVNLISNIGFSNEATHRQTNNDFACIPSESVTFPLKHPFLVICDRQADSFTQNSLYYPTLKYRVQKKLRQFLASKR